MISMTLSIVLNKRQVNSCEWGKQEHGAKYVMSGLGPMSASSTCENWSHLVESIIAEIGTCTFPSLLELFAVVTKLREMMNGAERRTGVTGLIIGWIRRINDVERMRSETNDKKYRRY